MRSRCLAHHCQDPISGSRWNSLTALYLKITLEYSFVHLKDLLSYFSKLSMQYKYLNVSLLLAQYFQRVLSSPFHHVIRRRRLIQRYSLGKIFPGIHHFLNLFKMAAGKSTNRGSFVFLKESAFVFFFQFKSNFCFDVFSLH